MTRKDVTALYGAGEPSKYSDVSDYNESGSELAGFPCIYSKLNGVKVFYDSTPPAQDAAPYYGTEAPGDKVLGIMLPAESAPYNVNGFTALLDAETISKLSKTYNVAVEHVNGMYEYYKLTVIDKGVQYIWHSDTIDMAKAVLYVDPAPAKDAQATAPATNGLLLVIPILTKNTELIGNVSQENGTYREELLYDGMVSIVAERLLLIEFSKEAIVKQIESLNTVAVKDVKIEQDATISARLSYPAWRITYTTGSNEDTRTNLDFYIQTDAWDYRFHTSTPVDSFAEYSESIESWIESINLTES